MKWLCPGRTKGNRRLLPEFHRHEGSREVAQYRWVAKLIVTCARMRKESRGLHYNIDFPEKDDRNWLKDTVVTKHMLTNLTTPI